MHYDNATQFINDCNIGMDIEFDYNGIGYGVLGWFDNGPLAYRKDNFGYCEQHFKTPDELLDGFIIDGKPLRSIVTQIELLLH